MFCNLWILFLVWLDTFLSPLLFCQYCHHPWDSYTPLRFCFYPWVVDHQLHRWCVKSRLKIYTPPCQFLLLFYFISSCVITEEFSTLTFILLGKNSRLLCALYSTFFRIRYINFKYVFFGTAFIIVLYEFLIESKQVIFSILNHPQSVFVTSNIHTDSFHTNTWYMKILCLNHNLSCPCCWLLHADV